MKYFNPVVILLATLQHGAYGSTALRGESFSGSSNGAGGKHKVSTLTCSVLKWV